MNIGTVTPQSALVDFTQNYLFHNLIKYETMVSAIKESIQQFLESKDFKKIASDITEADKILMHLSDKVSKEDILQLSDNANDKLLKMYHLAKLIQHDLLVTQLTNMDTQKVNYMIIQLEINANDLGFTRNRDQCEYYFTLESSKTLTDKSIIGWQLCGFPVLSKKLQGLNAKQNTETTDSAFFKSVEKSKDNNGLFSNLFQALKFRK